MVDVMILHFGYFTVIKLEKIAMVPRELSVQRGKRMVGLEIALHCVRYGKFD